MAQPLTFPAIPAVRSDPRIPIRFLLLAGAVSLSWLLVGDWLAALATLLLWAIWHFLPAREGPPVLSLALTFQWAQVNAGVYYHGLTGRTLDTIVLSDYRPMVLMGMGCVASLLAGLVLALRWRPDRGPQLNLPTHAFSTQGLYVGYALLLSAIGVIHAVAWQIPVLTQGILALGFLRLVALYLLLRRLSAPQMRWRPILVLLSIEVVLGFTSFFASFREPLMMLTLVLLERFDSRKMRHWVTVGLTVGAIFFFGILWLSIRTTYRSSFEVESFAQSRTARLEKVASLSKGWLQGQDKLMENVDFFIDRLWTVYYPALAVSRVPDILPHEDGRILWGAVRHVLMPRLFFPNKPILPSDSEMVRKYSDIWVAGAEQGTSIAFGYAAESYIDFGLPWMFLPVFAFGLLMGRLYRFFLRLIWHRELAAGLVTVIFWLSLYLFERSWIKTLGFSFTQMIFMGASVLIIDRLLYSQRSRRRRLLGLSEPMLLTRPAGSEPAAVLSS